MSDAAELERRAEQHDAVADEKIGQSASKHEGIAEGYRRAAQLLAGDDDDVVKLTFEFEKPVSCEDIQAQLGELINDLADEPAERPARSPGSGRTIIVRPLGGDARRYRIEQAPHIPNADAHWIEEHWTDANGWAGAGREPLAEASIDGQPAFTATIMVGP